jgi:RNA polymerase sigma-70 factor (ECF subfamily)
LAGDGTAWESVVRSQTRRVYNLCYRFTGQRQEAEDLTQEVFVRVFRTLSKFDPNQGSLNVWLYRVARNLLIDHYRATRRQRMTSSIDDEESPMVLPDTKAPSPHRAAELGELRETLQKALTRLSPELREAVVLRDLQGLDYREIGQTLAIPDGTVKSRINRGRAELAKILKRTPGFDFPGGQPS